RCSCSCPGRCPCWFWRPLSLRCWSRWPEADLTCAALYVISQTCFLGAILLTSYLCEAEVTHLCLSDPLLMPFVVRMLV
ncbi:MAG: hypothetical protein WBL39_05660, partial [Terrimicrobiaceae bacterium]